VNNLRDIPTDTVAGKRTLAVRLGDHRTRAFYVSLLVGAFALVAVVAATGRVGAIAGWLALPLAVVPVRSVLGEATGRALIPVLGQTGRVQLVVGLLVSVGVVLSA
jgi:1,4-dihydroxy-2-naphthoate octaprenyltransferase